MNSGGGPGFLDRSLRVQIMLAPERFAVVQGDAVCAKATVLNDQAQPISDTVVTWASSSPAVASSDAIGLVTGRERTTARVDARDE